MAVHARLAELVAARGDEVFADPGEFRAALEDYLTDDEITPGDRNVLVDAVRLGAVRRLLELLDQGSDPRASVNEAGIALARERGSDDARRSLRATAQLGYAVGRLDEDVVRDFELAMPPPPPPPPGTATRDATHLAPPHPAPAAPTQSGVRRHLVALAGGLLVVLGLVGVGVWWFLLRADSPEEVLEKWFAARSCEDAAEWMTGAAADSIEAEIELGDESGLCATFADYASEYNVEDADERGDRATLTVEGVQHYDGSDESVPDERDFNATFDLRRIDGEWLVSNIDWTYTDE
jgi:hypothetical protein